MSGLPPGVVQGPDGKFQSAKELDRYEDTEMLTGMQNIVVQAADLAGATDDAWGFSTNFEGVELYDFDRILDRDESADLVYAQHRVVAAPLGTQTADGAARAGLEVSASPSKAVDTNVSSDEVIADSSSGTLYKQNAEPTDTLDLVGPVLNAIGFGPFSDGASGVGGAGSSDGDRWEGRPADPTFHPRDELFLNGTVEVQNVDDCAVNVIFTYQHQYGIHSGR